jgi:hypothetical protein
MRVAVMTAPGEVHVEDHSEPQIIESTDAIIRLGLGMASGRPATQVSPVSSHGEGLAATMCAPAVV